MRPVLWLESEQNFVHGTGGVPNSTSKRGIEHISKELCRRNSSFLTPHFITCQKWQKTPLSKRGRSAAPVKKLEFLGQNSFEMCSIPRLLVELGNPPGPMNKILFRLEPEHRAHFSACAPEGPKRMF
jgi:hypothetical protein